MREPVDEHYLAASLDDKWRPAPSVRRLAKKSWNLCELVDVLRRLALADRIEQRDQATGGVRLTCGSNQNGSRVAPVKIEFYRRKQFQE